jgi:hypothetical protein
LHGDEAIHNLGLDLKDDLLHKDRVVVPLRVVALQVNRSGSAASRSRRVHKLLVTKRV